MEKVFEGSKAFLNIPVGIARDKELLKKPKTILLMGEIISMLNVTGEFFMSNKKISERLQVSTRTVNDYLDILEKKKLIIREKIVSDENNAIIGRKIHAGATLVKYISLGWGSTLHEGSEVGFTPLVKPTSHKKNRDNRTTNRTVNKSSSSSSLEDHGNSIKNQKSEEDPKKEKVYKQLFQIARMNDQWKGTRTIPTPDQIRQLRMLLYQCDYLSLDAVLQTFSEKMRTDQLFEPWKYVLQLMRDKIAAQRSYESWG
ncbi:HTH domain-containing protein [Lactobacillus crispatus]|uniref:HTH domain-containing protein n=1 Tax=Lactobacillus crispatus TaxID=47770 RepID=A0A7X4HLV6_9LACO|nr:HTH domain-containing protein [Lactobacillus crispatus]